jgi:hypothetical protein
MRQRIFSYLIQAVILLGVIGLYVLIVTRGRPGEWLP